MAYVECLKKDELVSFHHNLPGVDWGGRLVWRERCGGVNFSIGVVGGIHMWRG